MIIPNSPFPCLSMQLQHFTDTASQAIPSQKKAQA
jgi:hypothetical protein